MQQEVKGNIELKTSSGKVVPINKKNLPLGHHKAPSRTYKRQLEAILQVADDVLDAISKVGASRTMVKLFFHTVWIPAV